MPAYQSAPRKTAWGRFTRTLRELEKVMNLTEVDILAARFAKLEQRLAQVEAQMKGKTHD